MENININRNVALNSFIRMMPRTMHYNVGYEYGKTSTNLYNKTIKKKFIR